MIFAWLSAAGLAQSTCGPDPSADVDTAVAAIEQSFRKVDEVSFDRASKALYAALSCLDRAPSVSEVARIHQAMALASFVNGQIRACRRSLAAARLVDPGWVLDEKMFPASHPYWDLYYTATDPGPVKVIGKITPDVWVVDGTVRAEAPTERAFLLQVSDQGEIVWSGYLWDMEEVPDRGQSQVRSVLEPPHEWWLAARVHGGMLYAEQQPDDGVTQWRYLEGQTFAAGLDLVARYTPITVIGAEASGSILAPGDPVLGGGGVPAARAVALLGGAGWFGPLQPHAAARVGGSVDRVRAWENGADGLAPKIVTITSFVAGAELGLRTQRQRVMVTFDGQVLGAGDPWAWDAQLDGGAMVGRSLALEGMFAFSDGGYPFKDQPGPLGKDIGIKRDTEFRVGGGVALWY
ncbi:MAG: hypothetical protein ABMA64_21900 [Myxococcota bacterium]